MKETQEQLDRRIGALEDSELVRMLTAEIDERPVRELLAARAEARRRGIDPAAEPDPPPGDPEPRWVPPRDAQGEYELTGAWEPERLYPPYSMLVLCALALACDITARALGRAEDPEWFGVLSLLVLAGWFEFVHALYRLHVVLRRATLGRYPISPILAVFLGAMPCVNLVACFVWTAKVARFGAVNGRGRSSDRYVPALLHFAALCVMNTDGSLALLLLLASIWQLQSRLGRALAGTPTREANAGDWSSTAGS